MNDQDRTRLQNHSVLIAPAWATYVTSRQPNLKTRACKSAIGKKCKNSVNTNSSLVTWPDFEKIIGKN